MSYSQDLSAKWNVDIIDNLNTQKHSQKHIIITQLQCTRWHCCSAAWRGDSNVHSHCQFNAI